MKQSIVKNYLYNLSYQLLILILPLITTPYVSRVLKSDGVGTFSYTNSIVQYFILFGAIGLNLYGQREIAYVQSNKTLYSKVFHEILITRIITISISVIIYYYLLCQNNKYAFIFTIQILDIIASIFDVSWLFQGLEDFKRVVIRNFIIKLLGVVLVFLCVKTKDDLTLYVFLNSITLFLGNFSMWVYLPKVVEKIKFDNLSLKRHIMPAIALFIPQIATSLYTMLDKTMIGFMTGNESEVGYYEQSQKIIKVVLTLVTSLGLVMLPRIAKTFAEDDKNQINEYMSKTFKFVFLLATPLCLGMIAISPNFVPWFFGEGYEKVVPNMIINAPIIIFISISNVTGTQFLLPTKRQREYTASVILGSIVNIILNIYLIPKYLSIGAAFATLIAECSVTIIQIFFVKNDFKLKPICKYAIKYMFISTIMAVAVYGIGMLLESNIVSTMIQGIIGIITYGCLLLLFKDQLIVQTIYSLKEKISKGEIN